MFIPQTRKIYFLLLLGTLFLALAFAGIAFSFFFNDVQIKFEPLHSSIEGLGAVEAILMALLLLHLHHENNREKEEYFLMSMGFLMMGILDIFHSVTVIHHGFILLRSLANVFSGFWFALLWVPSAGRIVSRISSFPWIVTVLSVVIGVVCIRFRDVLPFMMENGEFTVSAIVINMLAGCFSLAAGLFYLRKFIRTSTTESYLFTCTFLLLGLAGIEFTVSALWGYLWWFWHAERVLAYIVVLVYMIRLFLWNRNELKEMNEALEERIRERTRELENEVAERTRYGLERDKVIEDLRDAKRRIKTLTGLLPICASCKKIRNADNSWEPMESYIQRHSEANFSHGLCDECVKKLYPDLMIE